MDARLGVGHEGSRAFRPMLGGILPQKKAFLNFIGHGPAAAHSHAHTAPPPPAPSFNFEYDDRFLGRLMRIPAAQLRQVDAPLQLMHALSFHFSRTLAPRAELRQPPPPLRHTQVALWPAQRARIMPAVTAMTCHRFSTAPASFNVYYRTASSWKALCLSRVLSGSFDRLQVRAFVQNAAA